MCYNAMMCREEKIDADHYWGLKSQRVELMKNAVYCVIKGEKHKSRGGNLLIGRKW